MAFITNNNTGTCKKLGERLSQLIGHSDNLDMLVGFFFFSGVKVIYNALKEKPDLTMRVLVGMEANLLLGRLVEDIEHQDDTSANAVKDRFFESMRKILGSDEVDNKAFHDRLGLFIELLESKRLDIRKTSEPNHAKLYIFKMDDSSKVLRERFWITGSSNFSEPGLKLRDEFNVEISDFGSDEAQRYFDDLWDRAVPITDDDDDRRRVVELLRGASVAADVSPYEAYYLVLKEYLSYQKSKLNEERLDRILEKAGFDKYRYQVDAVAQAIQKLDEFYGVIIADVVGLGKSVIASLVGAMRRRRGLIICPPGLMGDKSGATGGWYEYIQRFGLNDWQVWSRGKLDDVVELLTRDSDFDMVVVDEAHNFRNETTQDYANLANICFGREVVLLTATPFNNKPSDLLALLKLFLPAKSSPLGDIEKQFRLYQNTYKNLAFLQRELSKPNPNWDCIHSCMKRCNISPLIPKVWTDIGAAKAETSKRLKKLSNDVRQVMEKVVIRRNRLDLQNDPDYSREVTNLSKVCPPKEQYFELDKEQNDFYDRVINEYFGENGNFHGAIYHPQDYLVDSLHDSAQKNIYLMLRSQMIQRFESSFGAFRKSVENVLRSMETSLKFIERAGCFVYARKVMDKLLLIEDDADLFTELNEFIKEQEELAKRSGNNARRKAGSDYFTYTISDPAFEGEKFISDLQEDMELMRSLLKEIEKLDLENNDPKARTLVESIGAILDNSHKDIIVESESPKRKILVFSSYADTIEHVAKYVMERFPNRVIKITGENFGAGNAKTVKQNFDASFELQKDDYDILLATDKLSEGFNLNRAGIVINYDIPWNPTRVIQRVGRINRIGKKVFEKLYIFNFFPTLMGASIVSNREIAQEKMFAIHRILGEDAQVFSIAEEPMPSELFDKLTRLDDDETISFYTATKMSFNREKAFLENSHPEVLERINNFPNMIKTAWSCDKTQPHATFMFRRFGSTFSVIGYSKNENVISEWTLADAINQIKCSFDTPREEFSDEFWKYPTWTEESSGPKGVYEALKRFQPEGIAQNGGVPDSVEAVEAVNKLRPRFSSDLKLFASMVLEDIQNYGTIPARTISNIAKCGRGKDEEQGAKELITILESLRDLRGDFYLEPYRNRAAQETILVTIEKR